MKEMNAEMEAQMKTRLERQMAQVRNACIKEREVQELRHADVNQMQS